MIVVYTDGAPNRVVAQIVVDNESSYIYESAIPYSTNFEAEYRSIIFALEKIKSLYTGEKVSVTVRNDNNTVVQQILGMARIKEPRLRDLFQTVRLKNEQLQKLGITVRFEWVAGKDNYASKYLRRK